MINTFLSFVIDIIMICYKNTKKGCHQYFCFMAAKTTIASSVKLYMTVFTLS